MSIKAVCDDGFQSQVLYGPDSTVEDVYNHVLAVRMNSDGHRRYAAKIKTSEQPSTQSQTKNKNKGNGNNNNNKNGNSSGSFVYVLPSMKISAIFPQNNAASSSFELFLDGFRNVDNATTVIRDLRLLSSTIREIDSVVQNTISLHENGSLSNFQALESVRDNVRHALNNVQDCLSNVVSTGFGNDRKRPVVESIGNALSPVANKKLKLNDASAVPLHVVNEKKTANTPARTDGKQSQQQKQPQQQQQKVEGNQNDKTSNGKGKDAPNTLPSQVSANNNSNNKTKNQKKVAASAAISDVEISQPNAKKAKTSASISDVKNDATAVTSPISPAGKGKGKAAITEANKKPAPAAHAVNASVFTDSETETAVKPATTAPMKGAGNAKKAAAPASAGINNSKKETADATKTAATAAIITEVTEKPAIAAKKTLNAPVVSSAAAKAAAKKPATVAAKSALSSSSTSSSGSDSESSSSSGSSSDSGSDSDSSASSSSTDSAVTGNKQLLTEKGKLTLKARKQLQKQKQQAENTKDVPPAKANKITKKPAAAAAGAQAKKAVIKTVDSGSESDSESDSGSSDSDSDATFASVAKKTAPKTNAAKMVTSKKVPAKSASTNTNAKAKSATTLKKAALDLVNSDSEQENEAENVKPETSKTASSPAKSIKQTPIVSPTKTNINSNKKQLEKIDVNEPLDFSQPQCEPDSQATTAAVSAPVVKQISAATATSAAASSTAPKGVTTRVTRARIAQQAEPEAATAVVATATAAVSTSHPTTAILAAVEEKTVSEVKPSNHTNNTKNKTPVTTNKRTPVFSSDSSSDENNDDDGSDSSSTVVQIKRKSTSTTSAVTPAAKNKANQSIVSARDRITSSDSDSDHSTPIAPRQRPISQTNMTLSQQTQDNASSAPLPAALQKLLVDSTVSFKPPSHFLPAHIIQQQQQLAAPHSVTKHLLLTQSQSVLSTSSSDNSDNDQDDATTDKNGTSQKSTEGHKSPAYWAAMAQSTPSKFVDEVLNSENKSNIAGTIVPPMSASKIALGLDKLNRSQHTVSGTKSISTSDNDTTANNNNDDTHNKDSNNTTNNSISLIKNLIENNLSSEELRVEQLKHQSQVKKKPTGKTQVSSSSQGSTRPVRSTTTTTTTSTTIAMSQESTNNHNKQTTNSIKRK